MLAVAVTGHGYRGEQALATYPQTERPAEIGQASLAQIASDVLVFDRAGRFVSDLSRDQFELLVNGRPQPILTFALVTAGSPAEERQWAAAQGIPSAPSPPPESDAVGSRALFFFLDNLHMAARSVVQTREALLRYIDTTMAAKDRMLIVSATRNVGFMHEVTGDRTALRENLRRLAIGETDPQDDSQPPMSEAQALAISRNDPAVLAPFVNATLKANKKSGGSAQQEAEQIVKKRAAARVVRCANATGNTLFSLSDLVRTCSTLPGRKTVLVLSDGFDLTGGLPDATDRLLRLTGEASRFGVVIYSLDTGGAEEADAAASTQSPGGEVRLPPDGPRVLAAATGGRFLRMGTLDESLARVLAETSRYYLLGWQIEPAMLQSGNSKSLAVIIKDHPDYSVRLRETTIDLFRYLQPVAPDQTREAGVGELLAAIRSPKPATALPVFLYSGYTHNPDRGQVLQMLIQLAYEPLAAAVPPKENASLELMGAVLNKYGATEDFFLGGVPVPKYSSGSPSEKRTDFTRIRSVLLAPGIYQVRIAARDPGSGHTGSAFEWFELPPFKPGGLSLSSIFLRELAVVEAGKPAPSWTDIAASARRRFTVASQLNFFLYVYGSVRPDDASLPKIVARPRIIKGDGTTLQPSMHSATMQADPANRSIAFTALIPLAGLPAGSYTLEVDITDQSSNESATQRVRFWIE